MSKPGMFNLSLKLKETDITEEAQQEKTEEIKNKINELSVKNITIENILNLIEKFNQNSNSLPISRRRNNGSADNDIENIIFQKHRAFSKEIQNRRPVSALYSDYLLARHYAEDPDKDNYSEACLLLRNFEIFFGLPASFDKAENASSVKQSNNLLSFHNNNNNDSDNEFCSCSDDEADDDKKGNTYSKI